MRTLGRLAAELVGVLLAAAISFVVMIGCVLGILFLWACGIASGLFLMVALFSGTMSLFTHNHHAVYTMLGFLADAAVPFVLIVAMSYYYGKLTDKLAGSLRTRTNSQRAKAVRAHRGAIDVWL